MTPAAARHGRDADLVLEGGGVKGIALVGAVSVLEQAGYRFRRVAGTSAGSIVGALIAVGMTAEEMRGVMESLDYRRFRDGTPLDRVPVVGRGLSLWLHQGLNEGSYLRSFITEQLARKHVRTYADLREDDPESALPSHQRYKLIVHVSDVSRSRLLRFPWDYQPCFGVDADAQVVGDSIRASASIPFFFTPCRLASRSGEPSWLVDGGMMSNYPIDVFDRSDGRPARWPTIGIKLSAREAPNAVAHEVHDLVSLTEAMIGTLTSWYDRMHIDNAAAISRTIFVDTTGIKATDFDISKEDQARLYRSGRAAAEAWLQQKLE